MAVFPPAIGNMLSQVTHLLLLTLVLDQVTAGWQDGEALHTHFEGPSQSRWYTKSRSRSHECGL